MMESAIEERSHGSDQGLRGRIGDYLRSVLLLSLAPFLLPGCGSEIDTEPQSTPEIRLSRDGRLVDTLAPQSDRVIELWGTDGHALQLVLGGDPVLAHLADDSQTWPGVVDSVTIEVPWLRRYHPNLTLTNNTETAAEYEIRLQGERRLSPEESESWRRALDLAAVRRTMAAENYSRAAAAALAFAEELGDLRSTHPVESAAYLEELAFALAQSDSLANDVRRLLEESLALREGALPPSDLLIAQSLSLLASVAYNTGDFGRAAELEIRAHSISSESPDATPVDLAHADRELGLTLLEAGRYREATASFQSALEAENAFELPDTTRIADLHNNLSRSLRISGYEREALRHNQEAQEMALELIAATTDPDVLVLRRNFYITTLINEAGYQFDQGRYPEAEAKYRMVLEECDRGIANRGITTLTLQNIAETLRRQGRLEEALPFYEQARTVSAEDLGPGHRDLFWVDYQEADLWLEQGALQRAALLAERALQSLRAAGDGGQAQLVFPLGLLGRIRSAQGQHLRAIELHEEALELGQRLFGTNSIEVASSQIELAIARWKNDGDQAGSGSDAQQNGEPVKKARARLKQTLQRPELQIQAGRLLAEFAESRGETEVAMVQLGETLRDVQEFRAIGAVTPESRSAILESFYPAYQLLVKLCIESGDLDEALRALEESRSQSLVEELESAGVDLLAGLPEKHRAELDRRRHDAYASFAESRVRLSQAAAFAGSKQDSRRSQLESDSKRARLELARVTADLQNERDIWPARKEGPELSLEAVNRSLLSPERALLYYQIGTDGAYVLVMPGGESTPLAAALSIESPVAEEVSVVPGALTEDKLLDILERSVLPNLESPRNDPELRIGLGALRSALLPDEVWAAVRDAKEIIVVADGALNRLPFETLLFADDTCLLDASPVLRYAPSLRVLSLLQSRADSWSAGVVLTLGDPAVSTTQSPSDVRRALRSPVSLPSSGLEAIEIAKIYGERGVSLTGPRATEAALRSGIADAAVLHLATHGSVRRARGLTDGYLLLSEGSGESFDDGFLDMSEIPNLNMSRANLVTLSACRTHAGATYRGAGVYSLSRAFLVAGVPRVVASLWRVDDEVTRTFMLAFYRRLEEMEREGDVDPARALRDAKRLIAASPQTALPYYWAPFVLVGSGSARVETQ